MSRHLWIATRKGLFRLEHRDDGWQITGTDFLGDPVTMLLAIDGAETRFAALDHGHFGVKLHRSDDAGNSWREIAAPQYPPKPPGVDDVDAFSGQPIPWTLKRIWSLTAATTGTLWCGTMPGGLFRSDDGGDSWQLNQSLWESPERRQWAGGGADWPGIHSVLVDPRDPDHVIVGVSVGGVWATTDGGASWQPRTKGMWAAYQPPERAGEPSAQDPHCVAGCPAAPDVLWCQHHNGVFRSEDSGNHWREIKPISPSAFGFAVAVHPRDPDTAWFVPAAKDEWRIPVDGRLVVNRTRDGGTSFETLRMGLPQEHAYDLVYRHALAIDSSGAKLAFGSTTGGLWLSDDGGDTWQTLSTHLPPIYCVRFT